MSLGIEGFEGEALVGEGGFARVYRARQPAFDRLVAVKVLSNVQPDDRAFRQFDRERASIGSLSGHPNIVTVYEAGLTGAGVPYLAMEYLPNGSLADRLDRDGPLPWLEVAHIGIRLAGALESAHHAGLLHRDVKPENVMMSPFGEPQLTDFGIARVLTAPETRTVNQAVSVAHAAPEVLNGGPFSYRSDIYSLGSTLFTLLWGRPPFLRDDDELLLPLLVRITTTPPPDLRERGVPDAMCRALERAIAKQPSGRHHSALALAEEFQRVQTAAGTVATVPFVVGARRDDVYPPLSPAEQPTSVPVVAVTAPVTASATRPVHHRSRWLLLVLSLLVAVVLLASLRGGGTPTAVPTPPDAGGPTSAVPTTGAPTTTALAAVPFPSGTDPVPVGRYVTTQFTTPFAFGLTAGWRATALGVQEQLELVRAGGPETSALTLMQVTRVFDAQLAPASSAEARGAIREAPGDLVQWLRAHPRLTTGVAIPATRGALAGTSVDLQVALGYANPACGSTRLGDRCVLLFVNADSVFYGLPEGYRARVYVLRLGSQTLVATIEAPAAEFDRFIPEAEQVLATLRPPG